MYETDWILGFSSLGIRLSHQMCIIIRYVAMVSLDNVGLLLRYSSIGVTQSGQDRGATAWAAIIEVSS